MNENKKGLRGIHPDLKRLYQPITEKTVSDAAMSTIQTLDRKMFNTWQGYLLDAPSGKTSNTATDFTDLIEHDFESIDEAGSFVCSAQMHRKDLTNSYRKYLIGKKFSYEEAIVRKKHTDLSSSKSRIAYKIGDSENISGGTVLKYNAYSTAIDDTRG